MKVPGTLTEDPLEKVSREVKEELEQWNSLGLFMEGITASNESILMLKIQMQTLFNLILEKTSISEDDLNLMFQTVMRDSLKDLREKFTPEVERRRIAAITGIDPGAGVEVPELRLLGPDGKPVRI